MLQFLKYLLASFLGLILFFVLILFVLGALVESRKNTPVELEANSILKISFSSQIEDQGETNFDPSSFNIRKTLGLKDILRCIEEAGSDSKIKGIFLDMGSFPGGYASLEEIRKALAEFKNSKKPIYAYGESYSEKGYYLNSIADKIYIHPEGLLEFNGLSTEYAFYKGALEKLGIEVQVFRVGKFKSFVEPYTLDKMSIANRTQISSYLGSIYSGFMKTVSESRHIPLDSLLDISNNQKVSQASEALQYHLVTGLRYRDEVLEELKTLTQAKKLEDIHFISLGDYQKSLDNPKVQLRSQISVIYASGDISGGEGSSKSIGSEQLSRIIRKARLNNDVKAIVLRVNSPGGSALASDVIWREVSLAQKVKPVVVSMGDVAASGGYYIACAAGKIYAEPTTITGSIGIFGLIPNTQKFFNEKLGVTFDRVNTGKYSDILTISRPLKEDEKIIIQNQVNRGYQAFLDRVSQGRKKTKAEIDSIAQGRVWTGEQALKIGLVDQLGGLSDAILEASKEAKLKTYSATYETTEKGFLESLMSGSMDKMKLEWMEKQFGTSLSTIEAVQFIQKWTGIQARMPIEITQP